MRRVWSIWVIALMLGACAEGVPPSLTPPGVLSEADGELQTLRPEVRPDAPSAEPQATESGAPPSAASRAMRERYASLVQRHLDRGLLRRDPTPLDAPVTDTILARNFEALAFATEHQLGASGQALEGAAAPLGRWDGPVLVELVLGQSLTAATRQAILGEAASTVRQIAAVTNHPIRLVSSGGNFKVLVLSEDDRAMAVPELRTVLSGLPYSVAQLLRTPETQARCLVVGLSRAGTGRDNFTGAVALIRAELPGILRFACLQEEIAQGLGLPNDSRMARPSIFNDDDEFAVLTQHDLWLLSILYDPRLRVGQEPEEAMPIVRQIAAELTGALAG